MLFRLEMVLLRSFLFFFNFLLAAAKLFFKRLSLFSLLFLANLHQRNEQNSFCLFFLALFLSFLIDKLEVLVGVLRSISFLELESVEFFDVEEFSFLVLE